MTTPIDEALARLRSRDALQVAGIAAETGVVHDELAASGIGFAALGSPLEERWHRALAELARCIHPIGASAPLLYEGGAYNGAWIESTGTINAELLDRFVPSVTRETHLLFARIQRADGMIPYKVTADGPGFSQIQLVTPLARSVWNHYLLAGRDRAYLTAMYQAMARYDEWLTTHRDTRGSGGVEAFCTFDTGHDLSPRFWNAPERCFRGDATRFDPDVAALPYIAPDLTANIACQRDHLALAAAELGSDPEPWRAKAEASRAALFRECWDEADGMFYDRTADGELLRIGSDVLLRVLACEVGDDAFFEAALERHVLNTRRFLSGYGFTSVAMDDPRFDGDHTRNSWAGPVNYLTLIRAAHAFEHHGRVAELALTHRPILGAAAHHDRFPQCLDPWSGDAGYTESYSPSILWLLDTIERDAGVLPRPDGEVWLTAMPPTRLDHGAAATATAYARVVRGARYELAADDERAEVHRDGRPWLSFPRGWRVVIDVEGAVAAVVGMSARPVEGTLETDASSLALSLGPNDRVSISDGAVVGRIEPGFTAPRS